MAGAEFGGFPGPVGGAVAKHNVRSKLPGFGGMGPMGGMMGGMGGMAGKGAGKSRLEPSPGRDGEIRLDSQRLRPAPPAWAMPVNTVGTLATEASRMCVQPPAGPGSGCSHP